MQRDTLFLTDVFEHFRDTCLEIYDYDLANFYPALGLAWRVTLEMFKVNLEFSTDFES